MNLPRIAYFANVLCVNLKTCLLLTFAFALSACSTADPGVVRTVRLHIPASCAPKDIDSAYGVFYGGGDYEPTEAAPAQQGLRVSNRIELSAIPQNSRSLIVDLATLADRRIYRGLTLLKAPTNKNANRNIDVLLWPEAIEGSSACALGQNLGSRARGTSVAADDTHVLYTGGQDVNGAPFTTVANLSNGSVATVKSGLTRRLEPSVSSFGDDALIAGGADFESNAPLTTAEVLNLTTNDFEIARIELSTGRAEHGAVTLASGDVLLVGGRTVAGATRSLELIDPKEKRARALGLTQLEQARRKPSVVRLASGEIMVFGGTDDIGRPVPDIEWLAPDAAKRSKATASFFASREVRAVALQGGGALVVTDGDVPERTNVWRVSAEGAVEPAGKVPMTVGESFFLFPGHDDEALLVASKTWFRFDPWARANAFSTLPESPGESPVKGARAVSSGTPGLVMWIDDRAAGSEGGGGIASLRAFRFGSQFGPSTRSPYGRAFATLFAGNHIGLVPDRLPSAQLRSETEEGVALSEGETITLATYTYANFSLQMQGNALVVVRSEEGSEFVLGDTCGEILDGAPVNIARRGTGVMLNGAQCELPFSADARIALSFRGKGAGSRVKSVTVKR
jgi:hypothetical protein